MALRRSHLFLIVALVVLGLGAVWALLDDGGRVPPPVVPQSKEQKPPAAAPTTKPTTRPSSSISTSAFEGEGLEALPVPEFEASPDDGLELVIRSAENEKPVPDAEVMVVDFGIIDGEIWTRRNLDRRDPEEVVRSVSHRYRSGADGHLKIPWPRELAVVLVRSKGLSACARIDVGETGPIEIGLLPDTEVKARVLDSAGETVAECPLDVRVFMNETDGFDFVRARTDVTGIATFKNLDRYAALFRFDRRAEVRLGFPLADKDASTAKFSFEPMPADVLELRCPDTGKVQLEIQDGHGGLVAMDGFVRLRVKDAAYDNPNPGPVPKPRRLREGVKEGADQRGRVSSGSAEFGRVEVGLRLVADAWFPDGSAAFAQEFNGPMAAGETVTVSLIRPVASPTVTVRVLDVDRRPVANQRVEVVARQGSPPVIAKWVRRVMTDADGVLRTDLGDPEPLPWDAPNKKPGGGIPDPIVRLDFATKIGQVVDQRGSLAVPNPVPDPFLPGDVMLARGDVLLSGEVVDDGREPVRHARLLFEKRVLGEDGKMRWGGIEVMGAIADATGHFVAREMDITGEWRVRPERTGYMDAPWTEFRPGAELKLMLARGCKLAGNLILDPDIPAPQLRVRLIIRRAGADEKERPIFDNTRTPEVLGNFQWDRLPEGVASLSVQTAAMGRRSLFSLTGIVLRPGVADPDSRLKDIDLRGRLRKVIVTLQAPGGGPVDGQATVITKLGEEQPPVGGQGRITLLMPPETVDLRITNERFSTAVVEDVAADVTVRFRPPRVVRFRAPATLDWPAPPIRVGVNVDFSGHPKLARLYGGPRLVEMPRGGDQVFGLDGEVVYRVTTPTRMRVRWFLERTQQGSPTKMVRLGGKEETLMLDEMDDEVVLQLKPPADAALRQAKAGIER